MNASNLLHGKTALVTGASRGIGNMIAQRFAEEGAIVFASSRQEGALDDWASQTNKKFIGRVLPVYFDVCDSDALKKIILQIKKDFGSLDILVNNAALVTYEMLNFVTKEKMNELFQVNVVAPFEMIQMASKLMTRKKNGTIINISSIVGTVGVSGQLAYSTTKGALNALTKSAAKELAPYNIRVNAIAPGMINTERFSDVFNKHLKDKLKNVGMGRLGEASEVADCCVFLASDLSKYITGQIIGVDGSFVL